MADNRFSTRTFENSNFNRKNGNTNNFHFDNNYNESNHSEQYIPHVSDDWDTETHENEQTNTKQWSQSVCNSKDSNSTRSFQDVTRSLNQLNRSNNSNFGARISQDYVIHTNDVPRLIGKGGETIKQIQREYDAQIKVSNTRENQWIDVIISGSNDQTIRNVYDHITRHIGTMKEKTEFSQSKLLSDTESSKHNTNTNTFSFSTSNGNSSRDTNSFSSLTNQNNFRNDSNTYFHSANRGFNDCNRAFTGSSNNRDTKQSSFSRSQFGKSSNRRCAPAGVEDDDYDALFGSDEEKSNNVKVKQDNYNVTPVCPPASIWNTNNTDPTKRVDWAKMRRTDTANDMSKWKDFPPVIKEFYQELSDIAQMSIEDIQALRAEKNNIVVSWFDSSTKDNHEPNSNCKLNIPNPIYEFAHSFHNYGDIMNEITKQGFLEPSPIQCQAWPIALKGYDFIGIAQTGTGKTLAFLLPALIHIDNQPKCKPAIQGPKALILSPTRELAIQIHQEVQKYSYRGIRSAVIYGGSSRKNQIFQCESGVEIIIATPGRLNDLVMSNVIDLRSVTFLVLDEADRMLDMGFEPQIVKILLDIRPDRQTIMTRADAISSELIRKRISCQSIHGDREQSDREQALEDLKLGTVNILIATDVASRGLDIQDITVVFNYDLPKSMEDYVHRVGRTGRAGKTGYAISLVTRENWGSAGRLIKILEEAGQNVPGELREMAERFKTMQDRKRDFPGARNRYGNRDNDGEGRFFGLGSFNSRGGRNERDREKPPVMNSGKYLNYAL
ncbi:unnamed protein product [Rotaria magnacalcarata]|uniref:RNA helicase n=1 Tax=Rotaria magnacalcarata TaxID=392030 RepID=A0A8S2KAL4_9BILA|nr:unnamed protein product [Rotaria magnacalcarata]